MGLALGSKSPKDQVWVLRKCTASLQRHRSGNYGGCAFDDRSSSESKGEGKELSRPRPRTGSDGVARLPLGPLPARRPVTSHPFQADPLGLSCAGSSGPLLPSGGHATSHQPRGTLVAFLPSPLRDTLRPTLFLFRVRSRPVQCLWGPDSSGRVITVPCPTDSADTEPPVWPPWGAACLRSGSPRPGELGLPVGEFRLQGRTVGF